MFTIQRTATAGRDGVLHLDVPAPEGEYDVTVSFASKPSANGQHKKVQEPFDLNKELLKEDVFRTAVDRCWPPGYFESVMGSIDDESFVRHPQGEYPVRESLE